MLITLHAQVTVIYTRTPTFVLFVGWSVFLELLHVGLLSESKLTCVCPLSSNRQHCHIDVCLQDNREDY